MKPRQVETDKTKSCIGSTSGSVHAEAHPRAGWEEQFKRMAQRGDDRLIDPPTSTDFDATEWQHWSE